MKNDETKLDKMSIDLNHYPKECCVLIKTANQRCHHYNSKVLKSTQNTQNNISLNECDKENPAIP